MKKSILLLLFFICGILVFGQNLRDYTPLIAMNIEDAARLQSTRYVVPMDISTRVINGQRLHIFQSGNTLISFEMTSALEQQLNEIYTSNDMPLVLFSRRGTNRDNYIFVVDRLIPFREVFGVVFNDLPRNFTSLNLYEILDLYMENPVPDPDGRVAIHLRQAQAEAERVQEAARLAEIARLDAESREQFLNTATVGGGYRPIFTPGIFRIADIEIGGRIVVLGSYMNNQVRGRNFFENFDLTSSEDIIAEYTAAYNSLPGAAWSYPTFFFLTRTGQYFVLDRYDFYYDLIRNDPPPPYPQTDHNVIEDWIINNAD